MDSCRLNEQLHELARPGRRRQNCRFAGGQSLLHLGRRGLAAPDDNSTDIKPIIVIILPIIMLYLEFRIN